MSRRRLPHLLPFAGLALVVLLVPIPLASSAATRELTITANHFAFDPPVLTVNRGERVRVTVKAADVVHGFHLEGHGIDVRVTPGVSERVEFVADQPGKFRYRCSVSCGALHPFMSGELTVRPNLPFARAVALTLVVLAATLWSLWCVPPREPGAAA